MEQIEHLAQTRLTRRQVQRLAMALPAPLALAVLSGRSAGIVAAQADDDATPGASPTPDGTPTLAPTPDCLDDDDLDATLEQTEGPYFTPDSPERTSLVEDDMAGTHLLLTGYVYASGCEPVPDALIEFWQADDAGQYDNVGYRLRGHQFTGKDGEYTLETIVPGLYPGRTRHIHVKVQAPDQPVITTQLYFPEEPENDRDRIFDPSLVMDIEDSDDGQLGFFTFVVA